MEMRTIRFPGDRPSIDRLVAEVERLDGYEPLTEEARLAGARDQAPQGIVAEADGRIVACSHVRHVGGAAVIETAVHPALRGALSADLLDRTLATLAPGRIRLWASAPESAAAAQRRGFEEVRAVVHLVRSLPPAQPARIPRAFNVAPFRPHADVADFLEVHNAAFRGHPDDAGWTPESVAERMQRPWFDPDGAFMARELGRPVGVCWTKLHQQRVGEIYVIAVHPEVQGRSLGAGLVLTGLWDLYERRGAATATLYTEDDNTRARRLYEGLGFELLRTNRCFEGVVEPG